MGWRAVTKITTRTMKISNERVEVIIVTSIEIALESYRFAHVQPHTRLFVSAITIQLNSLQRTECVG
jgi:hypothetical protein